jgi:hypothetical protein
MEQETYIASYIDGPRESGFQSEDEAWDWIKDHGLCQICKKDLINGGFFYEVNHDDIDPDHGSFVSIEFEPITHPSHTMCGAEWFIETQSQIDEWDKKEAENEKLLLDSLCEFDQ